jgi:hypothetical protein
MAALRARMPAVPIAPDGAESGYSNSEKESTRISRFTSILYLVVALAAPVLVYSGPDVLSPSAPAIADAALAGRFTVHRDAACGAKDASANRKTPVSTRC